MCGIVFTLFIFVYRFGYGFMKAFVQDNSCVMAWEIDSRRDIFVWNKKLPGRCSETSLNITLNSRWHFGRSFAHVASFELHCTSLLFVAQPKWHRLYNVKMVFWDDEGDIKRPEIQSKLDRHYRSRKLRQKVANKLSEHPKLIPKSAISDLR